VVGGYSLVLWELRWVVGEYWSLLVFLSVKEDILQYLWLDFWYPDYPEPVW